MTLPPPARGWNIDEITVDCHDEHEQLTGFQNAFDEEANFPCPGTVIGETLTYA